MAKMSGSLSTPTLQNKFIVKIFFRKLQDLIYVHHIGVPPYGTDMAANKVREQENLWFMHFMTFVEV